MRFALIAALAAMFFALDAGCKKKHAESDEIVIGEYGALTGPIANFGQSSNKGVRLAVKQANAAGGVLGKRIRLVTVDNASDATQAATAVERLIAREGVVAIIGEVASKLSLAGGAIAQQNKVPMVSPASTNPEVTRNRDYVFRVCFTDDFQGPVAARFALRQGWKRVAILTDVANDYSKGLAATFRKTFIDGGGTVAADESFRANDKDFNAQLTKIRGANVDAVFLPGYYTEVGLVLTQARQLGMRTPFFGGDGWDSEATLALGSIADGCFFVNHYHPDDPSPAVQEFIKAFRAEYNETPDAMAILGYDAARVLLHAIRKAGSTDRKAIRDALAATVDFPGASGTITIDENRNARKPIKVLELRDGKTLLKESIEP